MRHAWHRVNAAVPPYNARLVRSTINHASLSASRNASERVYPSPGIWRLRRWLEKDDERMSYECTVHPEAFGYFSKPSRSNASLSSSAFSTSNPTVPAFSLMIFIALSHRVGCRA